MKTSRLVDFFFLLLAGLTSGAFLFHVPGFHYDEAWLAELASRIAFEPGFWPLHGMNKYTAPVMSYFLGGVFRLAGAPSLELARLAYWALNLASFAFLYAWVKKMRPSTAWIFALLWSTLPLSVFNQRLFLEVTTGYAFFFAVALWGFTLGLFYRRNPFFLALGVIAVLLGVASHILFFAVVFGGLFAAWKNQPEMLERPAAKWALTAILAPIFLLFLQTTMSSLGTGALIKAVIATGAVVALIVAIWLNAWRFSFSPPLVSFGNRVIRIAAAVGFFFFALFELSGIWPTSQTTGVIQIGAALPGLALTYLLGREIWKARNDKALQFFFDAWLAVLAITILTIYKPSSARYWELTLLGFLLLSALSWRPTRFTPALVLIAVLNLVHLGTNYFTATLLGGAKEETYRWLWVKDRALDYRPVVVGYRKLQTLGLCAQDSTRTDQDRNSYVLDVYRKFQRQAGKERDCAAGKAPASYYLGKSAPGGATLVEEARPGTGLGDLSIYWMP